MDARQSRMPSRTPRLLAGERLDRRTFHERYLESPEDFRAELIGGVVYLPPGNTCSHGRTTAQLLAWLGQYSMATPGTEGLGRTTILLGPDSEPEPDGTLLVLPSHGGQTREEEDLLCGPPELVLEVGDQTEDLDLSLKKQDYESAGVREYLVVALRRQAVHWFQLRDGRFTSLSPDSAGVLRSQTFAGLWLDPVAILAADRERMNIVAAAGLASPEHAAFVARLAAHRPETSP